MASSVRKKKPSSRKKGNGKPTPKNKSFSAPPTRVILALLFLSLLVLLSCVHYSGAGVSPHNKRTQTTTTATTATVTDDQECAKQGQCDNNAAEEEEAEKAKDNGDDGGGGLAETKKEKSPNYGETPQYRVLERIPHDANAFTQGLTFLNGNLYEGTGNYGKSQVRQLDPKTGNVLKSINMKDLYFGEGLSHFDGDKLIQITWREGTGFIYNATTLDLLNEFKYDKTTKPTTTTTNTGEGWGITYDPQKRVSIVTDGSEWIHFWDQDTFEETRRVRVVLPDGRAVPYLNELEWINGRILANVWYQDVIISINPETGRIEKVYDFSQLWTDRTHGADCFNGISATDKEGEIFVTGKQWPYMYRIKLLQ